MIEKYYRYKMNYHDYVIFIKSGIFYECIANDALIINILFNYKVKIFGNTVKVGFPIKNIDCVKEKMKKYDINYIIVEDDKISDIYEIDGNNYAKYKVNMDSVLYTFLFIRKVLLIYIKIYKNILTNICSYDILILLGGK